MARVPMTAANPQLRRFPACLATTDTGSYSWYTERNIFCVPCTYCIRRSVLSIYNVSHKWAHAKIDNNVPANGNSQSNPLK